MSDGFFMVKWRRKGTTAMVCSECGNLVFGRSAIQVINRYDECPWCLSKINMTEIAEKEKGD